MDGSDVRLLHRVLVYAGRFGGDGSVVGVGFRVRYGEFGPDSDVVSQFGGVVDAKVGRGGGGDRARGAGVVGKPAGGGAGVDGAVW